MQNFSQNGAMTFPSIGIYGFPDDSINPKDKVKRDWCVQFAQAIHSMWRNNLTGINYSDVDLFQSYRAYGNGEQSIFQYMDQLGLNKKSKPGVPNEQNGDGKTVSQYNQGAANSANRKGYMNVNFNILSPAPHFKNILLGMFEEMDYDVFADGIDDASVGQKQEMKLKLWIENQMVDLIKEVEKSANVQISKPDYVPKTIQEMEMFEASGGFKLKSEMAIERALKYTLDISEYKEIKRRLLVDSFELGVCGMKDYVDNQTQKVKVRYCDPAMSVIPFSMFDEFKNMPFAGEYVPYTISDIRAMNNPDGSPCFTEKELQEIAKSTQGLFGNPQTIASWGIDPFGRYQYDRFRVWVLDCEYKSDDYKYMTERKNSNGVFVAHEDEYGKRSKKTKITKVQMVYKCKWVVGTSYAFDYGHQFDIPRPTPSQANLSFHFYKIKGGSTIRKIIPLLDGFQLTWLKFQNAIAKARPKGMAIEMGSIQNVSNGNQKLAPLEVLKIANQTGDVIFQATTHNVYMPSQTNYKPIQELEGGIGTQGRELMEIMGWTMIQIQQLIGINDVASAASPNPDQLVGVSEIAMQATQNALKPFVSGVLMVKERACINAALRIQLAVKFNNEYTLGYNEAVGNILTQTLAIGSEINNLQMGIIIQPRPSQAEKQSILMAAQEAMRVGRQGVPLLNYSEYLMVEYFLSLGMLKWARTYIAFKEREHMDEHNKQQEQAIQLQGQQNKELQAEKYQAEQQLVSLELQKITTKGAEDRKTNAEKFEQEKILLGMQLSAQSQDKLLVESMNIAHENNIKDKEIASQEKIAKEKTPSETK